MISRWVALLAIAAAGLAATSARALPSFVIGGDPVPDGVVGPGSLSYVARSFFLGGLNPGLGQLDFESIAPTTGTSLTFGFAGSAITATFKSTDTRDGVFLTTGETQFGVIILDPNSPFFDAGRFNTTGATLSPKAGKWYDSSGSLTIEFSEAISAFGFYATDIGDFAGQVTITLTSKSGAVTTPFLLGGTQNSGGLLFWGFSDNSDEYTKITFGNTCTSSTQDACTSLDFFGLDDLVIGAVDQVGTPPSPPNAAPEPGSFALVALVLVALRGTRRRG